MRNSVHVGVKAMGGGGGEMKGRGRSELGGGRDPLPCHTPHKLMVSVALNPVSLISKTKSHASTGYDVT